MPCRFECRELMKTLGLLFAHMCKLVHFTTSVCTFPHHHHRSFEGLPFHLVLTALLQPTVARLSHVAIVVDRTPHPPSNQLYSSGDHLMQRTFNADKCPFLACLFIPGVRCALAKFQTVMSRTGLFKQTFYHFQKRTLFSDQRGRYVSTI